MATIAERLQFTVGQGPCLTAHESQEPVFASEPQLALRWPAFHAELVSKTPYRGVVSLPLEGGAQRWGTIDFYVEQSVQVFALRVKDVHTAASIAGQELADHDFHQGLTGPGCPAWLRSEAASARGRVAAAVGMVVVAGRLDFDQALAVLRGHAFTHDRDVDDLSSDLVSGRMSVDSLNLAP